MPNDDSKVPPGDDAETQSFGDVPTGDVFPAIPGPPGDEDPASTIERPGLISQAKLPGRIGGYRIIKRIASGGMGTVYLAQQEKPRRIVALKVMKHGIASRSALRRFEFESQILARLKHRNIAQVFEAGTHDDGEGGTPFFAMEYIPNAKTITEYVFQKKLSTRERLELFRKVCDAVHHGHQKGIIHRDLKPGNILVDSDGEPTIIDFGVARATDSDMTITTLQTDIGQLIGTMQYMSPEQCDADPNDLDARSDIYALGVLLYELLTERLPYDLSKVAIFEAARVIREEQPPRPSSINKKLRGDLEILTLKTLHKDRQRRYRSAEALADDISRYLNHEPISVRQTSVSYLLSALIRRIRSFWTIPIRRITRLITTRRKAVVYSATLLLIGAPAALWAYLEFSYDPLITTKAEILLPLRGMISNISTHHINWLTEFREYTQRLEPLESSNRVKRFDDPLSGLRNRVITPLEEAWDSPMFESSNYFKHRTDNLNWVGVRMIVDSDNALIQIGKTFKRSQADQIKLVNDLIDLSHQRLWIWTLNRLQSQISYLKHRNWSRANEPLVSLENSMHGKDFMLKMSNVKVAIDTHRLLQSIDETWRLVEELETVIWITTSGPEHAAMISFHSALQTFIRKQPSVQIISELLELHKPLIEKVNRIASSNLDKYDWEAFQKEFTTPDDWTMEDFQTWCDTLESHRIAGDG